MHCEMEDIRHAIYKMDFSQLDIDSLFGLYEIQATKKELDKIAAHIELQDNGKYILCIYIKYILVIFGII